MSPHRVTHALTPNHQTDYLTWARALRLSKFGPWEPIPENKPPSYHHHNIPEETNSRDTAQQPKRKPAFRKVLRGKILKFYERVLKPRFLQRSRGEGSSPEKRALAELQREIEKEEKMRGRRGGGGGGEKGRDRERRDRELRTAGQVARAVRAELKRRDTGGVGSHG